MTRFVCVSLLASLSALPCFIVGCASHAAPANAPASAHSDRKAPGDARVGDKTTCPVSGEEFTVANDSPKAEYQGKTYYFCCAGCDKEFSAQPTKYLPKNGT